MTPISHMKKRGLCRLETPSRSCTARIHTRPPFLAARGNNNDDGSENTGTVGQVLPLAEPFYEPCEARWSLLLILPEGRWRLREGRHLLEVAE